MRGRGILVLVLYFCRSLRNVPRRAKITQAFKLARNSQKIYWYSVWPESEFLYEWLFCFLVNLWTCEFTQNQKAFLRNSPIISLIYFLWRLVQSGSSAVEAREKEEKTGPFFAMSPGKRVCMDALLPYSQTQPSSSVSSFIIRSGGRRDPQSPPSWPSRPSTPIRPRLRRREIERAHQTEREDEDTVHETFLASSFTTSQAFVHMSKLVLSGSMFRRPDWYSLDLWKYLGN